MGDLVVIGTIEKSFGVRGEMRVRSLSDVPGRFEGLTKVTLESLSGKTVEATVERVRPVSGAYLVKMDVCATPEAVAAFRGWAVKIPQGSAPPLPQGQYYEYELIGLLVQDEQGRAIGRLAEILETPGTHVFVVKAARGETLIPATKSMVASVDVARGTMTIRQMDELTVEEPARVAL
ncbi:MAG: ribosome maturation factor RimM [Nitrospira sp.]